MSRRSWQVLFAVLAMVSAGLTVVTVPFDQLGPWAAGTLGPLGAIGAAVCVLSWPPQFDADPKSRRPPWRLLYLIPLLVTGVMAPWLVSHPPAGLSVGFSLGLALFLAYLALLGGVVVFLVILLPLRQLLHAAGEVVEGRRVSAYGPSAAALILTVTVFSFAGAFALDGIPDDEFGLFYMIAEVLGIDMSEVEVVKPGWLLAARLAGIGIIASGVGIFLAGKRLRRPDDST
jgi:hypothetical protein